MKIIEINNLSFSYEKGKSVLSGISFDLEENDSLGIIGPNGAGKTTLLMIISGLINVNRGLKIFGANINKQNVKEIRKNIGFVFQDPNDQLFMPACHEDLAYGLINIGMKKKEIEERIDKALDSLKMKELKHNLSHHLSHGEKKKIALATVLIMEPRIIIIDEPTANLDPGVRRELEGIVNNLSSTKIIASHNLDFISKTTNKTLLLYKGSNLYFGSTQDVIKRQDFLIKHGL